MGIDEKTYRRGGYIEAGVKPSSFRWIKSRARGPDGKVYQGKVGIRLQNKLLAKQAYYERNRHPNSD